MTEDYVVKLRMWLIRKVAWGMPVLLNWDIHPQNLKEGTMLAYIPNVGCAEDREDAILTPTRNSKDLVTTSKRQIFNKVCEVALGLVGLVLMFVLTLFGLTATWDFISLAPDSASVRGGFDVLNVYTLVGVLLLLVAVFLGRKG